jgi:PBP1b-binding outer membrane lipoprotein LpoB
MRRIAILPLLLMAVFLPACFGKAAPVEPVTDSSYFSQKLTKMADELVKKAARRPRKVAVLNFVNPNGKTSQLGKYITAKFSEISVQKNLFQTPTDGEIAKALKQAGIAYNGTLDAASAQRLGEAIASDAIVVGMISDLQKGSDVDLVVKMIDAKTGNVISASSASFVRSKQVSSMLVSY